MLTLHTITTLNIATAYNVCDTFIQQIQDLLRYPLSQQGVWPCMGKTHAWMPWYLYIFELQQQMEHTSCKLTFCKQQGGNRWMMRGAEKL